MLGFGVEDLGSENAGVWGLYRVQGLGFRV